MSNAEDERNRHLSDPEEDSGTDVTLETGIHHTYHDVIEPSSAGFSEGAKMSTSTSTREPATSHALHQQGGVSGYTTREPATSHALHQQGGVSGYTGYGHRKTTVTYDTSNTRDVDLSDASVGDVFMKTSELRSKYPNVTFEIRKLRIRCNSQKDLSAVEHQLRALNPNCDLFESCVEERSRYVAPPFKAKTYNESRYEHTFDSGLKLSFVLGDIVTEKVDAIVNAANEHLDHCGGVARAIANAAGPELQQKCRRIINHRNGPLAVGDAVMTPGGHLPSQFVIHVVGPMVMEQNYESLLRRTFRNLLQVCEERKITTVSLPAISTGIHGISVQEFTEQFMKVIDEYMVKFPRPSLRAIRVIDIDELSVMEFVQIFSVYHPNELQQPEVIDNSVKTKRAWEIVPETDETKPNPRTAKSTSGSGQPQDGKMSLTTTLDSLPGFPGHGTLEITYTFPDGIQMGNHPNPGKPYTGTTQTAYLPDTREGRDISKLLTKAFDVGLVFTVGHSPTSGQNCSVVWGNIHHKMSKQGGPSQCGYPDQTYLARVKEELAANGIYEA